MPCVGTVHLRRAHVDDAAGIARVHVLGWRRAHQGLVPARDLPTIPDGSRESFWREELALQAREREPWVALIDDRVVGFASAGLSRDDDAGRTTGEVYLVYVDPECWGRGIGQILLSHATRDLQKRGFDAATFWVVKDNAHARRFAEKHGWVSDGTIRHETCGASQVEQLRYQHHLA